MVTAPRRILAIGAHPDDVEFGCGGTLLRHHAQGDEVSILTFTRGERGGEVADREREARTSAQLIGARLTLLDFEDGSVPDGVPAISAIEAAIAACRPTHVYVHSHHDTHQDHRSIHAAARVAARGVAHLSCYEAPSSTVDFRPTVFIDITDFIAGKCELIGVFGSQSARRAIYHAEFARAAAGYWGRHAGRPFAEPFELMRQVDFT